MTLCTEVWQGSAVHAAAPGPGRPHEAVLVTLVAGGGVAVVVQRAGAPVLAVLLPPVRPVAALGVVLAHRLHQSEGSTGSRDQLSTNHSSPEHEVVYGDGVTLHHGLDVARNVRHRHGQLSTSSLYWELRSV